MRILWGYNPRGVYESLNNAEENLLIEKTAMLFMLACSISGIAAAQVDKQFAQDKMKAPELREVTEWINVKPLTLDKLKGKVMVVHFLTFG